MERSYIAIDLKSFYASVECMERGLDPLDTNLVVADASRTEKTICLAVSPSLKAFHIPGRARLFEVVQKVREVNSIRKSKLRGKDFQGSSHFAHELQAHPEYEVDYIVATPQMALYLEYSTRIYDIYLKYVAAEDMHVYSIDEVFIDATSYLKAYGITAKELAKRMILDVQHETGITATAGIGSNMYLCKVAMDIGAKHVAPDEDGVRIAYLNEKSYRERLWTHRPLTDFWRLGVGYAKKLEENGLYTMGDIARCSLGKETEYYNEDLLYRLFGVNAELLIDHAWGYENCSMADIKAYKPSVNSISTGQVLQHPHSFMQTRLIVREMADLLSLDLVSKKLVTSQIVLTIGYDIENVNGSKNATDNQSGDLETVIDRYGRKIPKHAHGTENLEIATSSTKLIMEGVTRLYDRIVNPNLSIRRINLTACAVVFQDEVVKSEAYEQLTLFTDVKEKEQKDQLRKKELEKEQKVQNALLEIKNRYGKNAIVRGMNLQEGATAMERNQQIGGHKA